MTDEHKHKISLALKNRKLSKAHRENLSKAHKGKTSNFRGRKHSEESKKKISQNRKGIPVSEEHKAQLSTILKGRVFSKEWRERLSGSLKGNVNGKGLRSEDFKKKLSESRVGEKHHLFGKPQTKEHTRKIRIAHTKRFQLLGISGCIDKNAPAFFDGLNKEGFNFQLNHFLEDEGYYVDGYDRVKNIVIEYDTPYHQRPSQRKRDLVRQNNIIEYFNKINNPLNAFIRIQEKNGKLVRLDVLNNKKYPLKIIHT